MLRRLSGGRRCAAEPTGGRRAAQSSHLPGAERRSSTFASAIAPLPVAGITNIFESIWCAIVRLATEIADQLVGLVNAFIGVLAAVAIAALGIFPDLPELPDSPAENVVQTANWLIPIGALLTMFAAYLALYVLARLYMAAVRLMDKLGMLDTGKR